MTTASSCFAHVLPHQISHYYRDAVAQATPLIWRDPTALWKLASGISVLFDLLLVYRLLFLPK